MEKAEIKEKVRAFIKNETAYSDDTITDESMIFNEGYLDSMGFVMLTTFIEEEFGIHIVDSDLVEENFESINAITDFVVNKQ
ncbi:MAG: acyl carrier protein [Bacteroidales bacterium]|nr:acyl carrier protein [Bacteroidales bacterium]MBP5590113.1 acyl carrier protein [Bacteroidales bacterium]MBP5709065.1 acyl carrier protein [Bacteroidales bacterium]